MERLSYGLVQLLNIFGHNIFRIEKGQFFGVSFWDYIFVHNLHFANLDTIFKKYNFIYWSTCLISVSSSF